MITNKTLSISREESSAIKGLLICLVVLGHNRFFGTVLTGGAWEWLNSFHVSSFFILPFLYDEHILTWNRIKKYFYRLFWPYSWMFLFLFVVNSCIQNDGIKISYDLFNTWVTGNFYTIRNYVGLQYLWFLPAMFSMLVIKDTYSTYKSVLLKGMFILSGGGVFYCILDIPE